MAKQLITEHEARHFNQNRMSDIIHIEIHPTRLCTKEITQNIRIHPVLNSDEGERGKNKK